MALLVALLMCSALAAADVSVPCTSTPKTFCKYDPSVFSFPADDGLHINATNEYYFWLGVLESTSDPGTFFGFVSQSIIFRANDPLRCDGIPAAVASFTGLISNKYPKKSLFSFKSDLLGIGASFRNEPFAVENSVFSVVQTGSAQPSIPDSWKFNANTSDFSWALDMRDNFGPVADMIPVARDSPDVCPNLFVARPVRPNLDLAGSLNFDGQQHDVKGSCHLAHVWGSGHTSPCWRWSNVWLEDSTGFLVIHIAGVPRPQQAHFFHSNKTVTILAQDEFEWIALQPTWTSPKSGETYHLRHRIIIPSQRIDVVLTAIAPDAEFIYVKKPFFQWYNVMSLVNGTHNGVPVKGRGSQEVRDRGCLPETPSPTAAKFSQ